jgi:hypothetical protein
VTSATLEVPILAPSLTNQREHWTVRHQRAKVQREAVWGCWMALSCGIRMEFRAALASGRKLLVTMTRRAPSPLDDDNLLGALKSVRDEVAERLGVDDRSPLVVWGYAQEKARIPMVMVRIEPLAPDAPKGG